MPLTIRSLNKNSTVPLYSQLYALLAEQIQSGVLRPGDKVPAERELAESLHVSRITARQALDALVESGLIYRERGRGTFVAEPKMRGVMGFSSFSADMRSRGLEPSSIVLTQALVEPDEKVRKVLKLGEDEQALHLVRLRLADGKPVALQSAYLPYRLVAGLEQEDLRHQSLYTVLREKYYINPAWTEAEMEAMPAAAEEAHHLQVEKGDPVLVVRGLTFTDSFEIVESVRTVYRGKGLALYIGRQRIQSDFY